MNPLADWDHVIINVSRSTASKFGMRASDWQDVAQEVRIWFLASARVRDYLNAGNSEKQIAKAIRYEALKFCQTEKAKELGYRLQDLAFYPVPILRRLLPLVWDEGVRSLSGQTGDDSGRSATKIANETHNLLSSLLDVELGLSRVSEKDRTLLTEVFRDGWSYDELAEREQVQADAIDQRVDRALARLRDSLGGADITLDRHDGPGARRVASNAQGQAAVE